MTSSIVFVLPAESIRVITVVYVVNGYPAVVDEDAVVNVETLVVLPLEPVTELDKADIDRDDPPTVLEVALAPNELEED